ncbi:TruB, partial [Plesiocystis pacifica SIR-1]
MGRKRKAESRYTGVLLVDKPEGPTSHDVVGWVRWALGERSVGHCGTLDPPASGLLVVCVGEGTKLVDALTSVDKRYWTRLVIGRSTTTADGAGETLTTAPVDAAMLERARELVEALRGPLELPPPAYSAVKVDGKRAHALARAGELVELPKRPMAVHALTVLGAGLEPAAATGEDEGEQGWIELELRVAKGTYIRSLAEELGRRLGCPAHMARLRRLACGPLTVDDPGAVGGLIAQELPPREGAPPRWRVELPPADPPVTDNDARRARAREWLESRLRAPWRDLPMPAVMLDADASEAAEERAKLVERLLHGQRLPLHPTMRARLGLENVAGGPCALVHLGLQVMILAVVESDEDGDTRLQPTRIVRLRACDPAPAHPSGLPGGD